jgi:hypothetical protein
MASTRLAAAETTAANGKSGMGQTADTTSTRHSKKRCRPASKCGECGQPLEEWEAGICEGCGMADEIPAPTWAKCYGPVDFKLAHLLFERGIDWRRRTTCSNPRHENNKLGDEMTTTRKNICQPADWWLAFETQATTMGYTLSEWIGLNCQSSLPADARAGLSERPAANRPKKSTDGC